MQRRMAERRAAEARREAERAARARAEAERMEAVMPPAVEPPSADQLIVVHSLHHPQAWQSHGKRVVCPLKWCRLPPSDIV